MIRSRPVPRLLLAGVILVLLAAACGADEPEEPTAPGAAGDFDPDLVAQAQEEGEVVLFTGAHTRESAELAARAFEEAFGISVTFSRETSGAIASQVEAELAAGSLSADVVGLNDEPTMVQWAEEGVIADAEVPNRDALEPTFDEGTAPYLPFTYIPLGIMYNTTVLEGDAVPKRWADLIDPDFDHVIVHADPRSSGVALSYVWGMDQLLGPEFYEGLTDKEILITESGTAVGAMVATGEADVAIPGPEILLQPLLEQDEPVGMAYAEEGTPAVPSWIAMTAEAPHPNAARLFVQFHLSEQFQQQAADAGARSVLTDGPLPAGGPELDLGSLVVVDSGDLRERRDELTALFEEHIAG